MTAIRLSGRRPFVAKKVKQKEIVEQTIQEEQEEKLLGTLAELGGQRVSMDTLRFEGQELILPETMTAGEAIDFLTEWAESQDEPTAFSKRFKYRPWDGAHAVEAALRKVFGSSGIQQAEYIFWSKIPPQRQEIAVGFDQTAHVPWGRIRVPIFEGMMTLGMWQSPVFGQLFSLTIEAAKKFEPHAQAIFRLVEEELATNSIYRGKAIDGAEEPTFLDLNMVDPDRVIYSEEALEQLEANIWSLTRNTEVMRERRMPLKRAILLHGPYGTGKTLAAFRTAQIATENGWTFIYCRPGQDVLTTVLATARLYQPAIVFAEDLDAVEQKNEGDAEVVSQLLDAFDGITTKGAEVMMVLTTNHPERINKAMLRPGRLDAVVRIGALDEAGVRRMIEALVPSEDRVTDLDYSMIYQAMEGFMPAFVKESIDRTLRYAIARGDEKLLLTTADFVHAARGLKEQLKMMMEAEEAKTGVRLESLLGDVIREAVHGVGVDQNGDRVFELNSVE
jgi:transitional endoplasmic reticulum ATPase